MYLGASNWEVSLILLGENTNMLATAQQKWDMRQDTVTSPRQDKAKRKKYPLKTFQNHDCWNKHVRVSLSRSFFSWIRFSKNLNSLPSSGEKKSEYQNKWSYCPWHSLTTKKACHSQRPMIPNDHRASKQLHQLVSKYQYSQPETMTNPTVSMIWLAKDHTQRCV